VALRWLRRAVAAVVVFAVLIVGTTAVRVWWEGRHDAHPPSDVIIVLGAAQYNGEPSEILAARLDHAAQLYRENVATRIMTLGGGQPGDRTTEGAAGKVYLERHGIPAGAVIAVPTGSNTYRSLQGAHQVMVDNHWSTAVIVTDPWHALRSRTMAGDLGIDVHVSPVKSGPVVQTRGTELRYITRETFAFLCYSLFGDGCEPGPAAA
jgi:uncharacterized SAM-binding protein YcdF (DUF218 family)